MSLLQNPNFRTRALTGIVFVAVIVAGIFVHQYTFFGLIILINFLCLKEFYDLTLEKDQRFFRSYIIVGGLLPLIYNMLIRSSTASGDLISALNLDRVIAIVLFLTFFLQLFYRSEKPFSNLALAVLGWIYISAPLFCCFMLYDFAGKPDVFVLLIFILVWINDTGAYLVGSTMGRTKFFERISPKKTWEGTAGGVLVCILTGALYGHYVLHHSSAVYAGLGLVIGVFSTLGDLLESQLKRSLGIKDSGHILPGHGGVLDRFDGFLMAVPAAYLYMSWFSFFGG